MKYRILEVRTKEGRGELYCLAHFWLDSQDPAVDPPHQVQDFDLDHISTKDELQAFIERYWTAELQRGPRRGSHSNSRIRRNLKDPRGILPSCRQLEGMLVDGVQPFGQSGAWNLIFRDEFEGNSLNTAIWEPSRWDGDNLTSPFGDTQEHCFNPALVEVSNGTLKFHAVVNNDPNCMRQDGTMAPYASGMVNSSPGFEFAYGYMECRMFVPGSGSSPGVVFNKPSFWTVAGPDDNGNFTWPDTGEIDVMEGARGQPAWNYHYTDAGGNHLTAGFNRVDTSPNNWGWHIYAAHWEPGRITWYYDGQQIGTWTEGIADVPHVIVMTQAVQEEWPSLQIPNTVEVDYVRVWQ